MSSFWWLLQHQRSQPLMPFQGRMRGRFDIRDHPSVPSTLRSQKRGVWVPKQTHLLQGFFNCRQAAWHHLSDKTGHF